MTSLPSSTFSFLFTAFFLFTLSPYVYGVEVQRRHTISIASLLSPTVCSSLAASNNSSLKVVHHHGPCSPLSNQLKLNHEKILHQDRSRVSSIHNKISRTSWHDKVGGSLVETSIPARRDLSLGTLEYIVTVGFGTPKRDFSLIFDTGSDISWIQCEQCISCYHQKEPIFNPKQSSTYSIISCDAPDCSLAGDNCIQGSCLYFVQYGDGSNTTGFFSQETLTLTSSDVLTDFKFGCGNTNQGNFGSVAGLLGLGHGEASLVSQTSQKYGGIFSYCLPPHTGSTGHLTLGAAGALSPNIKFTPMITRSDAPTFYFLELTGISVGGRKLPISPTIFSNTGTLIDSGTIITRMPSSAYSKLSEEFKNQMTGYPPAPQFEPLDTCYDLTGFNEVSVPSISLQFSGGATLDIDASGILYFVNISEACLAFLPNDDEQRLPTIIGNMQQRTYNVVYDISNGRIGFGSGGCS